MVEERGAAGRKGLNEAIVGGSFGDNGQRVEVLYFSGEKIGSVDGRDCNR